VEGRPPEAVTPTSPARSAGKKILRSEADPRACVLVLVQREASLLPGRARVGRLPEQQLLHSPVGRFGDVDLVFGRTGKPVPA
jgi:hypothetical protein